MSQPDLPPAVYVQEDIEEPNLGGAAQTIIFILMGLAAGLFFATQYFALLVNFTDRLIEIGGSPSPVDSSLRQMYRITSLTLLASGLLGIPFGYWYSKQPKTLRFRALASISLLLLAGSGIFFALSLKMRYPFWQFAIWASYYYSVPELLSPLVWAGGLGASVGGVGLLALWLMTSDQTFEIDDAYGSAHWGDGTWLAEGAPQTGTGTALSQAEDWGVPIGWRGSRMLYDRSGLHTYVQAPTGSGKTVGFVVPTLLKHPGSLLAIDIKRELYYVSARRRNEVNGDVHRLDPFAQDIDAAQYNPLDLIDTTIDKSGTSTAIDDARSIANTLVVKDEGSSQNPFFIDSARQLLFGLIVYVCATRSKEDDGRHLGTVRELLMSPNGDVEDPDDNTLRGILRDMGNFDPAVESPSDATCSQACARVIREQGNQFSQMGRKEFSSVASTARTQTEFLSSDHIQESISSTSFRFKEMQTSENGISVFLSLPADRLSDYYRWLRLMVISARTELIRLEGSERQNGHPTLFMIEEAPRLGRMEAIDEGLSLDRGYGIQYMIVAQSFNQLKDAYGEELANNILANCRMKMMWGAATKNDADMISDLCGQRTVAFETTSKSRSRSSGGGGSSKNISESIEERARDLVTADEVSRISEDWTFVFTRGKAPLLLKRPNYVEDTSIFGGLPDPHPEYSTQEEFEKARENRIEEGIEDPPTSSPKNPDSGAVETEDPGRPSPSESPPPDRVHDRDLTIAGGDGRTGLKDNPVTPRQDGPPAGDRPEFQPEGPQPEGPQDSRKDFGARDRYGSFSEPSRDPLNDDEAPEKQFDPTEVDSASNSKGGPVTGDNEPEETQWERRSDQQ